MEAAAKSIEDLVSAYLPTRPHHLSASATSQYQPHPNDRRLEEQSIQPLQYMTFLHDVDRGILLTRAYFDIRRDPDETSNNAPSSPKPRSDPNKPVTKLSLKDYKNRKKGNTPPQGNSPAKPSAPLPQPPIVKVEKSHSTAPKKQGEPNVAKEMDRRSDPRKLHPSLPPKPDVRRPPSPSPDRRKRLADVADDRPAKRINGEASAHAINGRLPPRPATPSKSDRQISQEKKSLSKDGKAPSMTTRRSALSNSHGVSPKPASQVNGSSQKSAGSNRGTPKKEKPKGVPPLLSPFSREEKEALGDTRSHRASSQSKQSGKRAHDDSDESPAPKKHRSSSGVPPLLSPTLPSIVTDELVHFKNKKSPPSKDSSQRSSQLSDSPSSSKKSFAKSNKGEDTIHVDSNNVDMTEDLPGFIVTMKYNKRAVGKTIARLLALAPKKKNEKKDTSEAAKRVNCVGRGRSESLKRPQAPADDRESQIATKRPRASESVQPSTPEKHKQSAAMQRVASSSSQVGTPGASNNLTPANPPSADRRPTTTDPEKIARRRAYHHELMNLGRKLKHDRDGIHQRALRSGETVRDKNDRMAFAIQSGLAYVLSFKAADEVREMERKVGEAANWKSLIPLLQTYRHDCSPSKELTALLTRLHAVCLECFHASLSTRGPEDAAAARELHETSGSRRQIWTKANDDRKKLGVFDTSKGSGELGPVAKLLDRIGPWSTPREIFPIAIEILRRAIRAEPKFTPAPRLMEIWEALYPASTSSVKTMTQ